MPSIKTQTIYIYIYIYIYQTQLYICRSTTFSCQGFFVVCVYMHINPDLNSNRWLGHIIWSVNCDVTGPLWHQQKAVPCLGWDESISNTRRLSRTTGCARRSHGLTTVLSLAWESPYLGKTVFVLRRGPALVQQDRCYQRTHQQQFVCITVTSHLVLTDNRKKHRSSALLALCGGNPSVTGKRIDAMASSWMGAISSSID